jgi:glycosyltransferase involved in cell wall biosynthesis
MKVGIYNRWLATLGGGEKHSLAIAEYLSRQHDVHVISHKDVSRDEAARRLNLDLRRVQFDVIPTRSAEDLKPLTGEYDLFVNASFMDFIPSVARCSAALIYFPAPVKLESQNRLRYRFGWAVKRWLMVPTLAEGFLQFGPISSPYLSVECGVPVHVKLPASAAPYEVSFLLANLGQSPLPVILRIDGITAGEELLAAGGKFDDFHLTIDARRYRPHDLVIEAETPEAHLALANFTVDQPRFRFFQAVFGGMLARYGLRFQLLPLPHSYILENMSTYQALWANSEYTRLWIRKYWGTDSAVLYPPVEVENFTPGDKKSQILSVGRFFAGDHNKKHDVLVNAFRELVDNGLKGWELHLVGGSTPGEVHQKYLADIQVRAEGYPIFVHTDLPYAELLRLYDESAIYWHASGYGEDENRDPVKFEHFGITTVEGMAAGCVPVVIGKGGQPEIVKSGINGYLWYSLDELKSLTLRLIQDHALRQQLADAAVRDSRQYSTQEFQTRLRKLLDEIGFA